eukprot:gene51573-63059_t
MCSYVVHLCTLRSYLTFRAKYSSLERAFVLPRGPLVALLGMLVFSLSIVSFLRNPVFLLRTIGLFLLLLVALTGHYVLAVKTRQGFSEDEQRIMFVAYVINSNAARKKPRSEKTVLRKVLRKAQGLHKASAGVLAGGSFILVQLVQPSSRNSSKQSSAKTHADAADKSDEVEDASFFSPDADSEALEAAAPQPQSEQTETEATDAASVFAEARDRFARSVNVVKSAKQLLARRKVYAEENKNTAQDD